MRKIRLSGCVDLDGSRDYRQVHWGIQSYLSVKTSWRRRDRALPDGLSDLPALPFGIVSRSSCGYFNHGCRKKRSQRLLWRAEGIPYIARDIGFDRTLFQSPAFLRGPSGWSTVKLSATREPIGHSLLCPRLFSVQRFLRR